MAATPTSEGRRTRLAEQRKRCPTGRASTCSATPQGKVIYVGKAKSIRKRVASHFSNPVTRGAYEMVDAIESVEFILVATEAEALLAEQNFIKQYRPRFNIRLRDDKSYPFIAISMDEDFPRVYFTRERHRRDRLYFGPYSNAKRVARHARPAREGLPVPLVPGRRARPALGLAVPRLLHQALRGALRRLRRQGASTARRSTASSRSSAAATARSSATSRRG